MLLIANDVSVRLIADYQRWTMLCFQVQGPDVLRISAEPGALSAPGPNGFLQGLQISSGLAGGIVQQWWFGKLYVIGNSPQVIYELQELPGVPAGTPV
jgi:hypothetical protein